MSFGALCQICVEVNICTMNLLIKKKSILLLVLRIKLFFKVHSHILRLIFMQCQELINIDP